MDWWGYSKEHGWVALDRSTIEPSTGPNQLLEFYRFRDDTTFLEPRKNWNPPLYSYAPNYLRDLSPEEAPGAQGALAEAQARWPEVKRQLQQQREQVAAEAAAERAAAIAAEKKATRERKKQLGLAS
jgi:hypothetical protein